MKSARLLSLLWIVMLGCNSDEPSYPIIPFIEGATLEYAKGFNFDSLLLDFNYRDGDFDLGLSPEESLDSPYHYSDFYMLSGTALTKTVPTGIPTDYRMVIDPRNHPGKIATRRRLKNAGIDLSTFPCSDFYRGLVLIRTTDTHIIDEEDDTQFELVGNEYYINVYDTFLIEANPNHYNITVDYLVEQADGAFSVFDWNEWAQKVSPWNCGYGYSYNGRFPKPPSHPSKRVSSGPFIMRRTGKFSGSMHYKMASLGYPKIFGGKRIKVRVSIKDRELHESNVIETAPILIPQ
jgi:hypothetical protein